MEQQLIISCYCKKHKLIWQKKQHSFLCPMMGLFNITLKFSKFWQPRTKFNIEQHHFQVIWKYLTYFLHDFRFAKRIKISLFIKEFFVSVQPNIFSTWWFKTLLKSHFMNKSLSNGYYFLSFLYTTLCFIYEDTHHALSCKLLCSKHIFLNPECYLMLLLEWYL